MLGDTFTGLIETFSKVLLLKAGEHFSLIGNPYFKNSEENTIPHKRGIFIWAKI